MKIKTQITAAFASGALLLSLATPALAANVTISGNGAGSNNNFNHWINTTKVMAQQNTAIINNMVNNLANTGNNSAWFNTGGASGISTGVSNSNTVINNQANLNQIQSLGAVPVVPTTTVTVTGNGAGSNNNVNAGSNSLTVISQTNGASFTNVVTNSSNTGNNSTSFNTGGSTGITTGGVNSNVSVSNQANANSIQN